VPDRDGVVAPTTSRVLSGSLLPHRLSDLPEPPDRLFLWGELPRAPAVAIVGTRHPTADGVRFAESLAYDLARAGVAVFSGGAEGIDTTAHLGALHAGGTTVVVAPAGIEHPFPAPNAELFQRVVRERGAYVSVVSDRTAATRAAFFARNACLVALSHVVVVVEAGFRSGALNAAKCARELGRPLLVVPHAPWKEKGRGCIIELKRGARVCEGPRDVMRELERMLLRPLPLGGAPVQPLLPFDDTLPDGLTAGIDRVQAAVAAGARNIDEVSALTGLPASEAQRHALTLTLDGVLAPDPSGSLSLVDRGQKLLK
jgi:DNA processing protein